MSDKSYKEEIAIDVDALDKEWSNQPTRFCEWAEKEVDAQFERDRAKEKLDLVKAEVDSAIRKNPKTYGINAEKITEMAISNAIIQDKRYKEALSGYLEKVKKARILGVAREAFDHRKRALEKLTDLFLSQYWSDPKEGKVTRTMREEKNKGDHYEALEKSRVRRREKE